MKKIIISTSIALFFGAMASAEVNFNEKDFDQALETALIKTDVRVWCGKIGQEFTKQMAISLRQVSETIPNSQLNQKASSQIENSASSFEGLCDKSIKKAIQSGLSESEISQLLQK